MIAQFGEYTPDAAAYGAPLALARGVYPKTAGSYGPLPTLASFSNALGSRCQGAFAGRSKAGNISNFAGDASKLYKLATATWNDVSKVGGYATNAEEHWRFVQFGERVIATNFADPIQAWTLDSSTQFADLSAAAPKARHIASMFPGFVMVGNTFDSVDGAVPNRVWWPALGDPTNWPTPGSAAAAAVQSDFNDMPTGGWVQSLIGAVGGAAGAIFMESAIYRVEYVGPPDVYSFAEVEKARGTPCVNSVVNVGPFAAYIGDDGFYLFNGVQSIPIGAGKVDKYFFSQVDQANLHRVYGTVDPINKLLAWVFPSSSSNGTPSMALLYNWDAQRWSEAFVDCEYLYRSLASGYTLEQLDTFSTSIDLLPASLDSRSWTSGRLQFSAFDTSHQMANFTGPAMAATIETGEQSGDGGRRVFVSGIRPVIDGGTVTVQIGYRDAPDALVTYTTATAPGVDGVCPQRQSARYARARISIAAGGTWSHASGVEVMARQEGER